MSDPIIQVLHVRYSDDGCSTQVYLNGKRIEAATLEDVDPGRGYSKASWAKRTARAQAEAVDFPTDFTNDVAQALADSADNQYLTDTPDDEDDEVLCPACDRLFALPANNCWLSDLHGEDDREGQYVLMAGHRQSADDPNAYGPFATYAAARDYARQQVVDGDWDPTGVTLTFSKVQP